MFVGPYDESVQLGSSNGATLDMLLLTLISSCLRHQGGGRSRQGCGEHAERPVSLCQREPAGKTVARRQPWQKKMK